MMRFRILTLFILTGVVAAGVVGYRLWSGPTLNERLEAAAEAGQSRRFEWLIWMGAEVDQGLGRHSYGGTPMMWRAYAGDLRAVKLYVKHGAYLDHTEKDMFTAATLAAGAGHWHVVEYLLRSGANFRIPDATGKTVVDYAVAAERDDILALAYRRPTPLSQWRIEQKDYPLRGGSDEPYNRSYRLMFRMAGSPEETVVTWFKALVDHGGESERIVSGPVDFRFAEDGNSVTVTYADGSTEHLQL